MQFIILYNVMKCELFRHKDLVVFKYHIIIIRIVFNYDKNVQISKSVFGFQAQLCAENS